MAGATASPATRSPAKLSVSRGSPAMLRPAVTSAPVMESSATAIAPSGPSASNTIRAALVAHGSLPARPDNRQPLPSRSSVSLSSRRTGPTVIGFSLTSNPAADATHAASIVSASGIGAAKRPATRSTAKRSDHSASAPPAASGSAASGTPVSLTACHSASGKLPVSALSATCFVQWSSNRRFMLSKSIRVSSRMPASFTAARGRVR